MISGLAAGEGGLGALGLMKVDLPAHAPSPLIKGDDASRRPF